MATTRILLKKSGLKDRLPAPASAEYGELFINYHSGSPMLSFKNDANEIVSIKPVSTIDGGAGETPPGTGNSIGDLIYDGTNLLVWNGTSWEKVGVADLSYTAKVDGGTVVSANGTDAEIPLVGVNAGLMSPGDKTLLGSLPIDGSGNFEQVQSNWDEVDAGSPAYINNKPDIPTNTSDLTNDGDGTSNFVTFDDIGGLGGGSVTSVDSGNGLDGGPITTSGTLSVKADGDTITVSADGVKVTDNKFAAPGDIPTNTSDLTNDGDGTSNFVTFDDIGGLGGGSVTSVGSGDGLTGGPVTTTGTLSVLADGDTIAVSAAGIKVADGKFAEPNDLPTNTSDLTNDGENGSDPFITANELPTKTSELTNDGANGSDPFITANDLPAPPDLTPYLEKAGGNMTGAVTQTELFVTSAVGGFDLSKSNFWACSLANVPTPTNGVNGQSGLIKFENVVTSWDTAFKSPPDITVTPAIVPFYVESPASILLGDAVEVG